LHLRRVLQLHFQLRSTLIAVVLFCTSILYSGVTDVKTHGGFLYVVSSNTIEIYDLLEFPHERIGLVFYPNNAAPIDAKIERNRLYVYYYIGEDNNGIRIYDLSNPVSPIPLDDITLPESIIQGGFSAEGYNADGSLTRLGQFEAYGDFLFFFATDFFDIVTDAYYYKLMRYHVPSGEMRTLTFWVSDFLEEECDDSPNAGNLTGNNYFVSDKHHFSIFTHSIPTPFYTSYKEAITTDPCFQLQNYWLTWYGDTSGPYTPKDEMILSHWTGPSGESSNIRGSGIAFLDLWLHPYNFYFYSEFLCTYAATHDGSIGELSDENSTYDVQQIVVHNGEIYLSSYYTHSIPHSYLYKDWGQYWSCADYWEFYDLDSHPYGMAAANGILYVAGEDHYYEFPLAKPDDELPVGGVYTSGIFGATFSVNGWAEDPEGIAQVTIRLDYAYQFLAHRIESCHHEEPCEGHCRPMIDPCSHWSIHVPLADLQPGIYTMKVIAEDMDGDFSMIYEEEIEIPDPRLTLSSDFIAGKPEHSPNKAAIQ